MTLISIHVTILFPKFKEIIGGILLGPTAIGKSSEYLLIIFPSSSMNYLGIIAQLGLVLYLFLVGMELDVPMLASHAKKAGGTFTASLSFLNELISRLFF